MSSGKKQKYYACSPSAKQHGHSHYNAICRDRVAKHNRSNAQQRQKLPLQNRGSRRQSKKKNDFEALFKTIFKRKIASAKIKKICWQITMAALMQPLQYDLRCPAAKHNSITHAAAAPNSGHSHYNAICRDRVAKHNRSNAQQRQKLPLQNRGSRRQSKKKTILKHFLKRFSKGKSPAPKLRKSADKSLWQP